MSHKRWGCHTCTNASHPYMMNGRLVRECRKDAPAGGAFPICDAEGWCMDHAFDVGLLEDEAALLAIRKAIARRDSRPDVVYQVGGAVDYL